jgi:hypothetical protein
VGAAVVVVAAVAIRPARIDAIILIHMVSAVDTYDLGY